MKDGGGDEIFIYFIFIFGNISIKDHVTDNSVASNRVTDSLFIFMGWQSDCVMK